MAGMQPRDCLEATRHAAFWASLVLGGAAHAADASEFWPQASMYVGLSPTTRLYLDASYARGQASDTESLDLSAFLDISIEPILREQLRSEDWQRSRYVWARVGYTRVEKASEGARGEPEDRGVVSIYAKSALPAEIWLEGRARADLRWIGGDYSTRYRLRLEATRELTLLEHTVVPYVNAEAFYDSRYAGWARALYMLGAEVVVNKHFRYEVYLGRQADRLPKEEDLNGFGLVAKWYY